jgi:hypothetical protein
MLITDACGTASREQPMAFHEFFIDVPGKLHDGTPCIKLPVWDVDLALFDAFSVNSILDFLGSWILHGIWWIFTFNITAQAWAIDFVDSFKWLSAVFGPLYKVEHSTGNFLKETHLIWAFLTASAFICVIIALRGGWAQGGIQLILALVIGNFFLAAIGSPGTSLHRWSPLEMVAGPEGGDYYGNHSYGLIPQAHNFGMDLLNELGKGLCSDNCMTQQTVGQQLAATYIWNGSMIVRYGQVFRDRDLEVYALAVAYSDVDHIYSPGRGGGAREFLQKTGLKQDDINYKPQNYPNNCQGQLGCGGTIYPGQDFNTDDQLYPDPGVWQAMGAQAHHDKGYFHRFSQPWDMIATQTALGLASLGSLVFVVFSCVFVFGAAVNAAIQAIKMLGTLLAGVIPGGPQMTFWRNVASLAASLMLIVFALPFSGIFILIQNQYLTAPMKSNLQGPPLRWALTGAIVFLYVVFPIAIFYLFRASSKIKASANAWPGIIRSKLESVGGGSGGGGGGGGAGGGAGAGGGGSGLLQGTMMAWGHHRDNIGYLNNLAARRARRADQWANLSPVGRVPHMARNVATEAIRAAPLAFATGGASLLVGGALNVFRGGNFLHRLPLMRRGR